MVKRYVPILKASEGELKALGALDPRATKSVAPVLDVQPVPDPRKSRDNPDPEPRTIEHHLGILARHLANQWPDYAAIDTTACGTTVRMGDGSHPLAVILDQARADGRQAIPVVRLDSDDDHFAAAAAASATDGRGACLRLVADDFATDAAKLAASVAVAVKRLGLSRSDVDLVVDLGGISAGTAMGLHASTAEQVVKMLPNVAEWRTLALAATSFPDAISDISEARLPRKEWHAWRLLATRPVPRVPDYGDYGITGAATVKASWAGKPNIRYTSDGTFVVLRVKGSTGPQSYFDLARILAGAPEFKGAAFSVGDGLIDRCAADTWGPGSATNWRMIGTNHHITLVTR